MNQESPNRSGSSLEGTLDEHRDLVQIVAEVESCLDRPPDREGHWIDGLVETLPTLVDTLRCHFSAEQQGALYCEVPVRFPRFADRLEKLAGEHEEILKAADDVIARSKTVGRAHIYEQRELNARVQLLISTIRRHEAEETEIILSAHWDEMGTGD